MDDLELIKEDIIKNIKKPGKVSKEVKKVTNLCKETLSCLEKMAFDDYTWKEWKESKAVLEDIKSNPIFREEALHLDYPYEHPELFTQFYTGHIFRAIGDNSPALEILPYILTAYYWNFQRLHLKDTLDTEKVIESTGTQVNGGKIKTDNIDSTCTFLTEIFYESGRTDSYNKFAALFTLETFISDFTHYEQTKSIPDIQKITPQTYEKYLTSLDIINLNDLDENLVHEEQFYRRHLYLLAVYATCELACCNTKGLVGKIDYKKSHNLFQKHTKSFSTKVVPSTDIKKKEQKDETGAVAPKKVEPLLYSGLLDVSLLLFRNHECLQEYKKTKSKKFMAKETKLFHELCYLFEEQRWVFNVTKNRVSSCMIENGISSFPRIKVNYRAKRFEKDVQVHKIMAINVLGNVLKDLIPVKLNVDYATGMKRRGQSIKIDKASQVQRAYQAVYKRRKMSSDLEYLKEEKTKEMLDKFFQSETKESIGSDTILISKKNGEIFEYNLSTKELKNITKVNAKEQKG